MCHSSRTARSESTIDAPSRANFCILFFQWAVDLKWIYGYSAEQMIRIYVFTKHSRCLQLKWTRRKIFSDQKATCYTTLTAEILFSISGRRNAAGWREIIFFAERRKKGRCKSPKSRSNMLTFDVFFWLFNRTLMLQGDSRLTGRMYREKQTESKCWKSALL